MHSPVVEKLPVVDKTLPPDHFYLAKVPISGQFPVVDKKSGISIRFCCLHFYDNLLFTGIYHSNHSFNLWNWVKLRSEFIQFSKSVIWWNICSKLEQEYTDEKPFNCNNCDKNFVQKNERVWQASHCSHRKIFGEIKLIFSEMALWPLKCMRKRCFRLCATWWGVTTHKAKMGRGVGVAFVVLT